MSEGNRTLDISLNSPLQISQCVYTPKFSTIWWAKSKMNWRPQFNKHRKEPYTKLKHMKLLSCLYFSNISNINMIIWNHGHKHLHKTVARYWGRDMVLDKNLWSAGWIINIFCPFCVCVYLLKVNFAFYCLFYTGILHTVGMHDFKDDCYELDILKTEHHSELNHECLNFKSWGRKQELKVSRQKVSQDKL